MLRRKRLLILICLTVVTLSLAGIALGKAVKVDLVPVDEESDAGGKAVLNYTKGADKTEIQVKGWDLTPKTDYIVCLFECPADGDGGICDPIGTFATNKKGKGKLHIRIPGDVSGLCVAVVKADLLSDAIEYLYGGRAGRGCGILWPEELWPSSPIVPKGRVCFTAETPVWVDGKLVQISTVTAGQAVGKELCGALSLEQVQEHDGTFECRDIVLESGNRISVVGAHCFMVDSGEWIAAQNLTNGVRLKTLTGTVGIKSITTRGYTGKVYNLKVKNSDQYVVGKDAVIVRDF